MLSSATLNFRSRAPSASVCARESPLALEEQQTPDPMHIISVNVEYALFVSINPYHQSMDARLLRSKHTQKKVLSLFPLFGPLPIPFKAAQKNTGIFPPV